MTADALLQIGEFAKLAGTNLRTLRYYEELGLLEPASRSAGGFRHYRRDQLSRMEAIKRLQDLGLPLREIATLVPGGGNGTEKAVIRARKALDGQIAIVEGKLRELQRDLGALVEARCRLSAMCEECDNVLSIDGCDPCPRDGKPMPPALRALL